MNNNEGVILVELTSKCNLKCDFCVRSKINITQAEMRIETLQNIIEKLTAFSTICLCGMGETLLYSKLQDALDILKEKEVIVVSNGAVPINSKWLDENKNIKTFTFSVEGPNEETSKGNCIQYNFDTLLKNMKTVVNAGRTIGINFLLNEKNIKYAVDMIQFCKSNHVSEINVLLPLYGKQWILDNHSRICEVLELMKNKGNEAGIHVVKPNSNLSCKFRGRYVPVISTEGKIKPCCDYFFVIPHSIALTQCTYEQVLQSEIFMGFEHGIYCNQCSKMTVSI